MRGAQSVLVLQKCKLLFASCGANALSKLFAMTPSQSILVTEDPSALDLESEAEELFKMFFAKCVPSKVCKARHTNPNLNLMASSLLAFAVTSTN